MTTPPSIMQTHTTRQAELQIFIWQSDISPPKEGIWIHRMVA